MLATIFLVLLYESASGLVLYWTVNNLFSLARSMAGRLIMPRFDNAPAASMLANQQ